ncbi:MAG TPA: NUDIX hydrolase [Ensifer sp.]|nr:NUDIX hydrolase [Ensifer sp.]
MNLSLRGFVWPQDGVLFNLSGYDVDVAAGPHPLYLQRREEIEANWVAEQATKPALFNGEMLIHRDVRIDADGRLTATGHLTPYATMLWWRKQPDRPVAEHLFPIAVPITSDGAILAIEMAAKTANAGRIYCAAGSLDAHDIVDGKVDLDANMMREVLEETGIDLASAAPLGGYLGVRVFRAVTLFRIFLLPYDAAEACARVRHHMETDVEQEIAGPVIIRDKSREGRNYPAFMPPIIDWIFSSDSPINGILQGD